MNKEFVYNVPRMVVIPSTCFIVSQAIAWLYGQYAPELWPHWRYVTAVVFPLLLCVSAFVVSNWRSWQKKRLAPARRPMEEDRRPFLEEFRLPPIPDEVPVSETEVMAGMPALYTGADGRQQMKLVAILPIPSTPQWVPSTPVNELTVIMGATALLIPSPKRPAAEISEEEDSLSGEPTRNEPYRKL